MERQAHREIAWASAARMRGRATVRFNGNQRGDAVTGKTMLVTDSWNHVVMTREEQREGFLNGELEIDGQLAITYPDGCRELQIGGRNDNFANFQGMIDEVAVYDRAFRPRGNQTHFVTAGLETIGRQRPRADAKAATGHRRQH